MSFPPVRSKARCANRMPAHLNIEQALSTGLTTTDGEP